MRPKVAKALEQIGWCGDSRLHVLVGDARDDVRLLVAAARSRGASILWRVPKSAHVRDAVVFYLSAHGFAARGVIGSEPLRQKSGWYKATVHDLDRFSIYVPLAFVRENHRHWHWTAYPRSYTTVRGTVAARLNELLNGYKRTAENATKAAGAGFGDPERNARVERAAVDAASRYYESQGWAVESKEAENLGYDLRCSRGAVVLHVEVKGVKGADCGFLITNNEKRTARIDPRFRLVAVMHALNARRRKLVTFSGLELLHRFSFAPVSFVAKLRKAKIRVRH